MHDTHDANETNDMYIMHDMHELMWMIAYSSPVLLRSMTEEFPWRVNVPGPDAD
jgi:hypothetical protein